MEHNGFPEDDRMQRIFDLVTEQKFLQKEISNCTRTERAARARLEQVRTHLALLRAELSKRP